MLLVTDGMHLHMQDGISVCAACKAIGNLTLSMSNLTEEAGGLVAVQSILNCMQQHIENEYVQEQACITFSNLTFSDDLHAAAADAGVISLIIDAMQRHNTSPGVQAEACGLLHNLSCGPVGRRCRRQMQEDGRTEAAVLAAFIRHKGNQRVEREARDALVIFLMN